MSGPRRQVIAGHVLDTPCLRSRTLSELTGAEVWIKFENLQFTASFKERGALAKLAALDEDERRRGVSRLRPAITRRASPITRSGLEIPCVIVMPRYTPAVKVERTRAFGAEVGAGGRRLRRSAGARDGARPPSRSLVLRPRLRRRARRRRRRARSRSRCWRRRRSSMRSWCRSAAEASSPAWRSRPRRSSRASRSSACKAHAFPALYAAFKGESPEFGASSIADGIAVREPGRIALGAARELIDDVFLVDEGDIEQAIVDAARDRKDGGGGRAARQPLAATRQQRRPRLPGRKSVSCSAEEHRPAHAGFHRRARHGALGQARAADGGASRSARRARGGDFGWRLRAPISRVHHQRTFTQLPLQTAEVEFVVQTRNHAHVEEVIACCAARVSTRACTMARPASADRSRGAPAASAACGSRRRGQLRGTRRRTCRTAALKPSRRRGWCRCCRG